MWERMKQRIKKNSEQDAINVYSFRKKSQTCIPKEFETFYFTRATVDVLNKTKELNSELHCRVNYCLFKRKMKRFKDIRTIMQAQEILCKYILHLIITETFYLKHI